MFIYGMRLRGFSIGCQPMHDFWEQRDDSTDKYHDLLVYTAPLSDDELRRYELDFICEE